MVKSGMFFTTDKDKNPNHPSGIPTGINKNVVGMMKDECGEKQIKKFIGLRSKLYSYEVEEGSGATEVKK